MLIPLIVTVSATLPTGGLRPCLRGNLPDENDRDRRADDANRRRRAYRPPRRPSEQGTVNRIVTIGGRERGHVDDVRGGMVGIPLRRPLSPLEVGQVRQIGQVELEIGQVERE